PVANAGTDSSVVFPGAVYQLNGSESFDPDGLIIKYQWKLIDGSSTLSILNPDEKISELGNLQPGYYVFELTVTDNHMAVNTDTLKLTVTSNLKITGENEAQLYPNPASSSSTINLTGNYTGTVFVKTYNLNGVVVLSGMF